MKFTPNLGYTQGVPFSQSEPAIALADFNDDHFPDLAVLSNGQLEVFLGKGDGTFGTITNCFVGTAPGSLLTADFNNDGKIDVAADSSAGLAILLGKGDGTFNLLPFSSDGNAALCASGDFNGDGNVDLITCSIGASILLGKGDGTFEILPVFQIHAVSGNTILAGTADFNGDGKLDLFGVQDAGYIWMTLGNGDGTFGQTPLTIGSGNIYLALVADFDRDGRPDLAIGDSTNIFDRQGTVSTGVATLLNVSALTVPPGFHVSASALSPSTVSPGGPVTSTIKVSPMSWFGGDVTFACSSITLNGSPATKMPPVCSFGPNPVKSASGATILTVSTTPATNGRLMLPFGRHSGWYYAVFLPIFGIVMRAGLFKRRKPQGLLLLTLMLSGLLLVASCGGSGVKPGSGGTPAGSYTITVTGSAKGATSQTTTMTFTVQ